jgi:5S rRNA maturation endonuclease (ribonuclease M5)
MNVDAVLDKLEHVRRSGDGWVARCPAHEDRVQSLSIKEGDTRIVTHCFAGCDSDDILAELGLDWRDVIHDATSSEPEAVYKYVDENDVLLFEVVRHPGKRFHQRKANGDTNLNGTRRVLYRLPEVVKAIQRGATIYLTEGEKDAESLRAIGKVATCSPGGANNWKDEYASFLTDANVIITQDRDDAGRAYAAAVKESLKGIARAVKVVEAKVGKDVTDHLEAGCAVEELVTYDQRHYRPLDLFVEAPPVAWVVENVVVAGEATLLIADGGAGKSFFALAMSLAVAGGEPFLHNTVQQGRVIYVDEENSPDLALQRLWQLGATDQQKQNICYLNFAGVDIVRHPEKLIEDALLTKPKLIVIDSHAKVTRASEENSNNEMGRAWDDGLLPLARRTKAAVLVIHHTNGYGGTRGASQIRNSADQVLTMKRQEDGSQLIYASKPRRLSNKLHFQFTDQGFGRYGLVPV